MLAAGYADVLLQTTAGTMTQPVARLLVDGKSALARGDTLRWASAEAARLGQQRLEELHALDASADEFRAGEPRSHAIPQNRER
jgi:predicted component of type VI protein secretion system